MMQTGYLIGYRSFTILVIMFTVGTSILIAPSGLALAAHQDAWLACLLGCGVNVALVLLYIKLGDRYPSLTLVQYCETALGRWIGKGVALAFILFLYLLTTLMIGDLGIFLTSQIMWETPIEILKIIFVIVLLFGLRQGMKAYSIASEVFFAWMLLLFGLLLVGLISKYELNNIRPMLEFGIMPIVKGAYSFYGLQELVILLMIYPYVRKGKGRGNAFLIGSIFGSLILVLTTLSSLLIMGASLTSNQLFPAYVLAKHLSIGQFFERLEGIMMLIWILTIFVKTVLTFHAALIGTAQLLRLDSERPLAWPMSIAMVVFSLVCYPNSIYVRQLLAHTWPPLAAVFMIVLPLVVLLVSMLRGQNGATMNKSG